jgi:3-methylcrotonyl-CoA carboxylase beta subunit
MCGRAYEPNFMWMWPNSRISVMGGEQAAGVLTQVKREQLEARGENLSSADEAAIREPVMAQYERQGHPYYASARLWDDGIIDPRQTREVLSMAIQISLNKPQQATRFGVFRM